MHAITKVKKEAEGIGIRRSSLPRGRTGGNATELGDTTNGFLLMILALKVNRPDRLSAALGPSVIFTSVSSILSSLLSFKSNLTSLYECEPVASD